MKKMTSFALSALVLSISVASANEPGWGNASRTSPEQSKNATHHSRKAVIAEQAIDEAALFLNGEIELSALLQQAIEIKREELSGTVGSEAAAALTDAQLAQAILDSEI